VLVPKYDPNEPRDPGGKWTDGGSDGSDDGDEGKHPGEGYSTSARLIKGVIHTNNVYDAQRALFEKKKVELSQPKQVSTLIKRLGETAKEMEEHGEKAPLFNLCDVSVKGTNLFCAESKGIPRVEMPVIPAKQTKAFVAHLEDQGYVVEKGKEYAANLRATQDQIDGAKVAVSMKRLKKEGVYKRIIVSKDDYILDGHHTWAGQLGLDAKDNNLHDDKSVKIFRVDISITKLLAEAEKWTGGKGKKPAGQAELMIPVGKVFAAMLWQLDELQVGSDEWNKATDAELAAVLKKQRWDAIKAQSLAVLQLTEELKKKVTKAHEPREETEVELWPDQDEGRYDFMDRCILALIPCVGEDKANEVCAEKWDESKRLGRNPPKKSFIKFYGLSANLVVEPCGKACVACKGASAPFKDFDESEHPRDDHGRFTDAGGGSGATPDEAPAGSHGPFQILSKERVATWLKQAEEAHNSTSRRAGGDEDVAYQQIRGALGLYLRTDQPAIDHGNVALFVAYDDDNKLQAAVATRYSASKKESMVAFGGGLDNSARTAVIKRAAEHAFDMGAQRVESAAFHDEEAVLKSYKDAGFREVSRGHGVVSLIIGKDRTAAEETQVKIDTRSHVEKVKDAAFGVAKDLKYDTDKIIIATSEEKYNFTLNGKQCVAAGLAYTRDPDPNLRGKIKLFPDQIYGEQTAKAVTAHEIEHIKFQNAYDRYQEEFKAVMSEPPPPPRPEAENYWERVGGSSAIMHPDGSLRAPYDKKYPAYTLMHEAYFKPAPEKFVNGDGVSPYSEKYWKQWEEKDKSGVAFFAAQHETLAEMAIERYMKGSFPLPKGTSLANKRANSRVWRSLYRAVDKVWKIKK
jgi:hypothetical protein